MVRDILALRPTSPPEPVSDKTMLPVLIERFGLSRQPWPPRP